MSAWTPEQWILFLTALGGFATTVSGLIITIILQLRGNAKTEQARVVSADNNRKITAVVAQTREIARAVPDADTTPTDNVTGTRVQATRAGDPPITQGDQQ